MTGTSRLSISDVIPKVLPPNWKDMQLGINIPNAKAFMVSPSVMQNQNDVLRVIATVEPLIGEEWWLHVSFSRSDRLPSWEDLKYVKEVLIGKDKLAVQLLPREDDYLNVHPYTLHLYRRVNGDTLSIAPKDVTVT